MKNAVNCVRQPQLQPPLLMTPFLITTLLLKATRIMAIITLLPAHMIIVMIMGMIVPGNSLLSLILMLVVLSMHNNVIPTMDLPTLTVLLVMDADAEAMVVIATETLRR